MQTRFNFPLQSSFLNVNIAIDSGDMNSIFPTRNASGSQNVFSWSPFFGRPLIGCSFVQREITDDVKMLRLFGVTDLQIEIQGRCRGFNKSNIAVSGAQIHVFAIRIGG